MLTTLKNAFKIKEIRKKLLFTFLMLVVIRIGCQLPVPGVNRHFFSNWFAAQTGDTFSFFNAFTGGSFENMSLFALNITPYITSSIIIQLLTIAIPKLEEMQRDGEEGRKKLTSITRYVTVGLALIESAAMAIGFGRQGLMDDFNALNVITVIAALTAGSAFLMWIGERITEWCGQRYFYRADHQYYFPYAQRSVQSLSAVCKRQGSCCRSACCSYHSGDHRRNGNFGHHFK